MKLKTTTEDLVLLLSRLAAIRVREDLSNDCRTLKELLQVSTRVLYMIRIN